MPVIPIATGVWPKTSVKDVAESLGLAHLSDEAAAALAADVEYRLTQLIEVTSSPYFYMSINLQLGRGGKCLGRYPKSPRVNLTDMSYFIIPFF